MKRAVFPGSFDPITLGHYDIILRALDLFDEIIVAIGVNTDKRYMFSLEERKRFIAGSFLSEPGIKVMHYEGLTIDFCKQQNAGFMLRGLRNPLDFEFEKSIAHINYKLSGIETIFLLAAPDTSYMSSSIVRDIIKHGGDYAQMVPEAVRIAKE